VLAIKLDNENIGGHLTPLHGARGDICDICYAWHPFCLAHVTVTDNDVNFTSRLRFSQRRMKSAKCKLKHRDINSCQARTQKTKIHTVSCTEFTRQLKIFTLLTDCRALWFFIIIVPYKYPFLLTHKVLRCPKILKRSEISSIFCMYILKISRGDPEPIAGPILVQFFVGMLKGWVRPRRLMCRPKYQSFSWHIS